MGPVKVKLYLVLPSLIVRLKLHRHYVVNGINCRESHLVGAEGKNFMQITGRYLPTCQRA